MDEYNIIVAGVGGQGILFLSEVLGEAAVRSGLNVRVAEIHGMAQRGGSVICNVRIGDKVYSPLVSEGEAHLIIALEPIEALRHLSYANHATFIVVSTNTIKPPGLYLTNEEYPGLKSIISRLENVSKNVFTLSSLELARKAGNPATSNTIILGVIAASRQLPIKPPILKETIRSMAKKKFRQVNMNAFELGYQSYPK